MITLNHYNRLLFSTVQSVARRRRHLQRMRHGHEAGIGRAFYTIQRKLDIIHYARRYSKRRAARTYHSQTSIFGNSCEWTTLSFGIASRFTKSVLGLVCSFRRPRNLTQPWDTWMKVLFAHGEEDSWGSTDTNLELPTNSTNHWWVWHSRSYGLDLIHLYNMDQTAVFFYMPPNYSVVQRGQRRNLAVTQNQEKKRVTEWSLSL